MKSFYFEMGNFVKSFDPFTDTETLRHQQLTQVQLQKEIGSAEVRGATGGQRCPKC